MTDGEPPSREGEAPRPPRSAAWAWLQLLRPPNLLTVPGDPLAGFLLAQAAGLTAARPGLRMALAASVSLLMYSAGLLWNDWFDLAEDRRERPRRPLPSGLVRPGVVALAGNVLIALAVAVAAVAGPTTLHVAVALGAAVMAYNALAKRLPVVGPLVMGLCRGLSVLLGAAAFGAAGLAQEPVLACAGGATVYIAAVSVLAAGETRPDALKAKCLLVTFAFAAWCVGLILTVPPAVMLARWALTAACALAAIWLAGRLAKLGGEPTPAVVQRTVGSLIRALVLIQAAAVISTGRAGAAVAAALAACFVLSALLARRFYGS